MHQLNKQCLTKIGVNPCLFPLIKAKQIELIELQDTLDDLPKISSFTTKSGDLVDRATNEDALKRHEMCTNLTLSQMRKLNAFLEILQDPNYNGYCTTCGDNVPLSRVIKATSTICISCAKLAEN